MEWQQMALKWREDAMEEMLAAAADSYHELVIS